MIVSLEGRVIVVTGAASGIGAAIARQAARSGAAGLLLTDMDADGLERTSRDLDPTDTQVCVADLSDPAAPGKIVDRALSHFGRVDGLVNAAGLTNRGSVTDGTIEIWDTVFAVNARAAFFLMQAAIRDMLARKSPGTLVNILSINAHCGAADLAIYSATKGALSTLTRNAAHAHLSDRIRVNGINLGWVNTPSEDRMQSETLGRGPGWLAEETARLPLGRMIEPEEAANLATYLLSDASVPITGVAIDLNQRVTGAPV